MRLSTTPTQRLVTENHLLVSHNARSRDKEPLALANEGVGLAAVTVLPLSLLAALKVANELRLESFLGSDDAADGSTFGNTGDKPVPFVVPAKELVLDVGSVRAFSGLANHQEQVTVLRLNVENLYIGIIVSLNVEELSTTVLADVDHDGTGSSLPSVLYQRTDFRPCAELLELGLNEV